MNESLTIGASIIFKTRAVVIAMFRNRNKSDITTSERIRRKANCFDHVPLSIPSVSLKLKGKFK